jgi:hypothetical protein
MLLVVINLIKVVNILQEQISIINLNHCVFLLTYIKKANLYILNVIIVFYVQETVNNNRMFV